MFNKSKPPQTTGLVELTPEQTQQVAGGIIIVGGIVTSPQQAAISNGVMRPAALGPWLFRTSYGAVM